MDLSRKVVSSRYDIAGPLLLIQLSSIRYLPEIIQHAERFEGGKLLRRDGAQQVLV